MPRGQVVVNSVKSLCLGVTWTSDLGTASVKLQSPGGKKGGTGRGTPVLPVQTL